MQPREHKGSHTHTCTNFALAYKWLLCHYHAQGLQGRLSSYFEPHKWSASLTVTKQQSPSEVSDFQTPQLCIDEICKANVMNHNEDPPLFFHILPTLWMKTWNLRLHQQQGWILQRGRLSSGGLGQQTSPPSYLTPTDTIQVYDNYHPLLTSLKSILSAWHS